MMLDEFIERFGWTLLHSVWQFGVIAICVLIANFAVSFFGGVRRAKFRYVIGYLAMVAMVVVSTATFLLQQSPNVAVAIDVGNSLAVERAEPFIRTDILTVDEHTEKPSAVAVPNTQQPISAELAAVELGAVELDAAELGAVEWAEATSEDISVKSSMETWTQGFITGCHKRFRLLVILWFLGAVLFSLRSFASCWEMSRLRRGKHLTISLELDRRAKQIAAKLGIVRTIMVRTSSRVDVPLAFGMFKPIVLLPVYILSELTPQQVDLILAHEIAHIRRHDFFANLLQTTVESIFFYHPATWWISSAVRVERENCCDDLAMKVVAGDRIAYARTLLAIDERRTNKPGLALAASGNASHRTGMRGSSLRRRIQRIIGKPSRTPISGWGTMAVVIVGMLIAAAWLHSDRTIAAENEDSLEAAMLVQVVDRNGKPLAATIHQTHASYSENTSDLKQWDLKTGGAPISLSGLTAGMHTLVADALGDNPTIFDLKIPAAPTDKVSTIQLDEGSNLEYGASFDPLECRLRVVPAEGKEFDVRLELEFTNRIDTPIRLPMFTMTTMDTRLFIPRSFHDGVIEIKGHSTQKLQFSWRSILQNCVWTGRNEPIGEPWPANDPPEGERYFRFNVGRQGLVPVALPTPESIFANKKSGDATKAGGSGDWMQFSTNKLPSDMPRGNTAIPTRDWRPAPQSTALLPEPGTEETGWIDAEYFLQYRIRVEQNDRNGKPTSSAIPLLYLDIRNTGEIDFGFEMHQSRHHVIVGEKVFTRADQPWGGYNVMPKDGSFLTLPFLLSRDWQDSQNPGDSTTPLGMTPGTHKVRLGLTLPEIIPAKDGQPSSSSRISHRNLRTREFEILIPDTYGPTMSNDLTMENIRRELVIYPRFHAPVVTENFKWLVLHGQPTTGDYLISQAGRGTQSVPDPASSAIAQLWDSMTRAQIDRYLNESMEHFVRKRESYPCDIEAAIAVGVRFRTGYHGLPSKDSRLESKTTTRHFLDGKLVGEPFNYEHHTTVSTWIKTAKLKPGEHVIELETDYEFQRDGEKFTGTIRSPKYRFRMVPQDQMPDDLIVVPEGEEAMEQIAEAIYVVELEGGNSTGLRGWQPQMRWGSRKELASGSLHTPSVWIDKTLPYDLCVIPVIQIKGTNEQIRAAPIVVPAGVDWAFYLKVEDLRKSAAVLRRHADENGFVSVVVALMPSRSIALSYPEIKKYLGLPVCSQTVRMRIDHDVPKGTPASGTRKAEETNDQGGRVRIGLPEKGE